MISAQTNETQASLVKAARTLFFKFGIKKVTIEDIAKEANVSKMTFYRTFKNKEDIAVELFKKLYQENMAQYRSIMDSEEDFTIKIQQVIEVKQKKFEELSADLIEDVFNSNMNELSALIEKQKKDSNAKFINDLWVAQKKGWIRKDLKIDFLLYMLEWFYSNMKNKQMEAIFNSPQEMSKQMTDFFFYGIMNNKK